MKMRVLFVSVFVATTFHAVNASAESTYYVQSASAKILSEPSFKSKVVAEVGMGQPLSATGKEGSWTKVVLGDKWGYISSLLLSTHPPLNKIGVIKAEDAEIKQGVRRRTSSFASAGAARGLTKEDRQRADVEERADFAALGRMESVTFSSDEIAQFIEGRKL